MISVKSHQYTQPDACWCMCGYCCMRVSEVWLVHACARNSEVQGKGDINM